MDVLCRSLILNIQDDQGVTELLPLDCRKIEGHSAELLPLHQEVLGPRCKVPRIEVWSTESRRKDP